MLAREQLGHEALSHPNIKRNEEASNGGSRRNNYEIFYRGQRVSEFVLMMVNAVEERVLKRCREDSVTAAVHFWRTKGWGENSVEVVVVVLRSGRLHVKRVFIYFINIYKIYKSPETKNQPYPPNYRT
jgi:hypothetical protein